jgi:cyclopropane fatty-acyl-phospholipid synthase-like methyltransferase
MTPTQETLHPHLEKMRVFYENAPTSHSWIARGYRRLLAHYYNLLIPAQASVLEIGCGSGELLAHIRAGRKVGIDLSARQIASARVRVPAENFMCRRAKISP